MIILRQKSYSWDEIKRASKAIGTGALVGGIGGFAVGPKDHTNPKPTFLAMGIGAGVGALGGFGAYRIGHKERLKAKEKANELYGGVNPREYFISNLPKNYKESVDRFCKDLEKLNGTFRRSKGIDLMYLNENNLVVNSIDYSSEHDITNYFTSNSKNIDPNNIPLANLACVCFDTVPISEVITYNIKTKKFSIDNNSFSKLSDLLLGYLEFLLDFIKEDIEGMEESNDEEICSEEFVVWKKEYYEKAKNIIKQVRI